jgi:hypothetical protein
VAPPRRHVRSDGGIDPVARCRSAKASSRTRPAGSGEHGGRSWAAIASVINTLPANLP